MSLRLENLSYRYGSGGQGVHDVSLCVGDGKLLAVIGPSGSGKSTLLRLVAGLIEQQAGRVVLAGRDLAGVPVHRRDIGMVFQSYALFPHLSVRDNVTYGLKMRNVAVRVREDSAMRMLHAVGLADLADRPPAKLSGGQQQRVALARALAFGPKALLLDEPLSALDAAIRGRLRDEIRQLQRQFGATACLVSALAMGTYGTALALVGTQVNILPLMLLLKIGDGGADFAAAAVISLILLALCSTVMGAGDALVRRSEQDLGG